MPAISYGARLEATEYRRRMLALHEDEAQHTRASHRTFVRRQELYLTIDHRLGVGFPEEQREALWRAHQRVQRGLFPTLVGRWAWRALGSKATVEDALARLVLREYGRVLSPDDLTAMTDVPMRALD
jgi:hypothetical protein